MDTLADHAVSTLLNRILNKVERMAEDVQWLKDSHAEIISRLDTLDSNQRDIYRLVDRRGADEAA